mgnify:FL=1|jgi:DNA anti-recombination protein RmuC|tara:strand:- start:973 stop:1182 length:210 start_codon:yes stop_codon:yes gene_type:complete
MNEANIISFKIFIDPSGNLMSEYSKFPKEKVDSIFYKEDVVTIKKILRELEPKLENLHKFIEDELNALS